MRAAAQSDLVAALSSLKEDEARVTEALKQVIFIEKKIDAHLAQKPFA